MLFYFLFFFCYQGFFFFFGMVQCFIFLSFLPPLTNFGLVAPIPVGIRVLGVEREEDYKTKLIPP